MLEGRMWAGGIYQPMMGQMMMGRWSISVLPSGRMSQSGGDVRQDSRS